jgi:hypothetical protein
MNINNIKPFACIAAIFFLFLLASCGTIHVGKSSFGYDLQGARIPTECKTANVQYFINRASQVDPTLALNLTEKLKDKILSDTPLKLTNNTGDVNFEGSIESSSVQAVAPQAGSTVTTALNRLTITIHVKYGNAKDSQWDFDSSFSRYIDYSSSYSLDQAEKLNDYDSMLDLLVQDIYTKAFVNW